MIITYTFTMARWQIDVKRSEATKQSETQTTTKTNKPFTVDYTADLPHSEKRKEKKSRPKMYGMLPEER